MKKAFYLLLVFALSLNLVSCSSDDDNDNIYFKIIEGSWIIKEDVPEAQYKKSYKFYEEQGVNLVDYLGIYKKADKTREVVTFTKLCIVTKDSIIMNPYGGSLYTTRDVSRYAYKLENNILTLTTKNTGSATGQTSTRFVRQ